jgi:hypothetical protein
MTLTPGMDGTHRSSGDVARDEDAQREAVIDGQGLAVHLKGEQGVARRIESLAQWDRSTVGLLAAEAGVPILRVGIVDVVAGVGEDIAEADAGPGRRADGADAPLQALGAARGEGHVRTAVAGALQRGGDGALLEQAFEIGEGVDAFAAVGELDCDGVALGLVDAWAPLCADWRLPASKVP